MIRLVVNADDLGLDPAIDRGILLAHREGIVTSASLLPTGRSAADAVRAARSDGLALGVHLCLTTCLPPAAEASRVPSLAPQGRFRRSWMELVRAWLGRKIHLDEVDLEFRAQLSRARELGANPDHLDGHQHLHLLPEIAGVVASIAREEGLPVRWPREDAHLDWAARAGPALKSAILNGLARAMAPPEQRIAGIGLFEAGVLSEDRLCRLLSRLRAGDYELGCHPGLAVPQIDEDPDWRYGWDEELSALCSPRVKDSLRIRGIQLCRFSELVRA